MLHHLRRDPYLEKTDHVLWEVGRHMEDAAYIQFIFPSSGTVFYSESTLKGQTNTQGHQDDMGLCSFLLFGK